MTLRVERYRPDMATEWNAFVTESKNGTFLFDRGFMDHHAERFDDLSLVVRDARGRLVAALPASRDGGTLVSHGGLTYGGFVTGPAMTAALMLDVFDAALGWLAGAGVGRVVYKCVPHIYHAVPAEEDGYALFRRDARLVGRDVSAAIDTREPPAVSQMRARRLRRARRVGLTAEASDDFAPFWAVLETTLRERHGRRPVHSAEEIAMLARRFPQNVLLFTCDDGAVLAGSVVFLTGRVCHVQYNAASPEGMREGAQDLVLASIIERFAPTCRWIDFGISTEERGQRLNEGLASYKEGFGARAVDYDTYALSTT